MSSLKQVSLVIINWFLDLLFPQECLGCAKDNVGFLCAQCLSSLPINRTTNCHACGRRSPTGRVCQNCRQTFHPALSALLVASDWENPLLRQIIYKYKYNFVEELAQPLTKILIDFLETNNFFDLDLKKIVLIPVPLHKKRELWRGFNQSLVLAKKLSDHFALSLNADLLIRCRSARPQAEIKDATDRQNNIKKSFSLSEKKFDQNDFKNKTLILVDDVSTTTSTLSGCARVLKKLKPKEILGLVIARG